MGTGHAPGGAIVGAALTLTIVAGAATLLRLFTRVLLVHGAGWDDFCIAVALVFSIAMTITMCKQVENGVGRHWADLSGEQQVHALQWMWASIWVYNLALGATKTSILLQYLRIFPQLGLRRSCFILIGVIAIYTLWTFFGSIFACMPVEHFWYPTSSNGSCLNRLAVWFFNAAVNIVTDIATATIPLPVLKSLALPKRQRIALMVVFSLGGVTCIISILRLQSLYAISKATDSTWENPMAAIFSNCEVNIGIIASCLPTLKGCVTTFFPRVFNSSTSHSNHQNHNSRDRETPAIGKWPSKSGSRGALSFDAFRSKKGEGEGGVGEGRNEREVGMEMGKIQVMTTVEQDVEMGDREGRSGHHHQHEETERVDKLVPGTATWRCNVD